MVNSVDPDQTAPIGAVCSGSTLFASILNLSVNLGNYLQQTTSADDIFRCIFFLGALRVNYTPCKLCLRVGILFSCCPCVRGCVCACFRACIRPSVMFCFLNNLKSHCWIFIKPCKHVYICKTNTLDKKVRARGQFC